MTAAWAAAAFHAAGDELADGEGIKPYCATCGAWIGTFHSLAGWRHFRGDPAPAFCPPPGRALCPAQARVLGQALAEAITYQLHYLGGCVVCGHDPAGTYPDHTAGTGRASSYGELITALARFSPEITGEER